MIYYLFCTKGWEPNRFYNLPAGERDLIAALSSYEIEHRPGR
jgi:hypothetical protein